MKKFLLIGFLSAFYIYSFSQDYSSDKTTLSNFLKRMYNNTAFEGVKIVEDYDNSYLISVVSLEQSKYNNESTMSRVAQIKARQQASVFLNGSSISSDLLIQVSETKKTTGTESVVKTIESIREHSVGFVQGMELMINFLSAKDPERMVFIYASRIEK
jgi:hypothetical protein